MEQPLRDFDAAYDNRAAVPGAAAILAAHTAAAAAFRESHPPQTIAHGSDDRAKLDLFLPDGTPTGLFVFVHGGYWRALARTDFSHMAKGMHAHGWAVAVVGYPLCPAVCIAEIGGHVAAAIARAAGMVDGPILLAGHSAGGHLAARQASIHTPLPADVAGRVAGVLGISGIYDLRPLRQTAMNADLRLDHAEATAESPVLHEPKPGVPLVAWVGAAELPELRRQSSAMASLWHGLGASTSLVEAPGAHHFDVIDPLTDPDSAMVAALLEMAAKR